MIKIDDAYKSVNDAHFEQDSSISKQNITIAKASVKEAEAIIADNKCNCTAVHIWMDEVQEMVAKADTTSDISSFKSYTFHASNCLEKAMKELDDCSKKTTSKKYKFKSRLNK